MWAGVGTAAVDCNHSHSQKSWVTFGTEGTSHPLPSCLFSLPLDSALKNTIGVCSKNWGWGDQSTIGKGMWGIEYRCRTSSGSRKLYENGGYAPMHFKGFLLPDEQSVDLHTLSYLTSENPWGIHLEFLPPEHSQGYMSVSWVFLKKCWVPLPVSQVPEAH